MEGFLLHFFTFFVVFLIPGRWRLGNVVVASQVSKTISVSRSGGDYNTISQAIANGVPANNSQWIKIKISAGEYKEQVKIPYNKRYILLEGAGAYTTTVTFSYGRDIRQATIIILADNIVVRGIAFKNTFNLGHGDNERAQAVAARVAGDKVSFHECRFQSLIDTIYDEIGRHFFDRCYIEGSIDFIYGNGQSVYEKCQINVTETGFITAHSRISSEQPTGFVFKSCSVYGKGKTYLGRAYRAYSRVIFFRTILSDNVVPEGWDAWNAKGREGGVTFAEVDCNGPGSDTSKRVKWAKKLDQKEIEYFMSPSFHNVDGWVEKQP